MPDDLNKPNPKASVAYLARVLGIESVLLPPDLAAVSASASEVLAHQPASASMTGATIESGPSDAALAFLIPYEHFTGETRALWAKMVQAMKQDPDATGLFGLRVVDDKIWDRLLAVPRQAVVVLGETAATRLFQDEEWIAARWLEPRPGLPLLVTHGLDAMLANPDLKRSAWLHLQMVMKRLP